MSEDKKRYYKEWEQEHREERNKYRREKYREKCKQRLECEIENGIKPKQRKQRVTLKQQLAELKAENERLKKYETIYYLNQLQASNEDIDKFKQNQIQQSINISDLLKDNTKQVREKVCEEIRSRFLATCQIEKGCDTASFSLEVLNRILDQIQDKGEKE